MKGTNKIEDLIPHRVPFLFVDEILSADEKEIIGMNVFDNSNVILKSSYLNYNYVPETILLESMAQCGGAGVRLLGISNGIFALVQIETVEFYKAVKYGDQVKHVITNLRMSEKIIKQSGKAYVGDELIFEASWMSLRID